MSEVKKTIQKNIALYRKNAHFTQKEVAEHLNVAPSSLASWEQGKSLPDIDTLFRLCDLLNVDILTISGFEFPEPSNDKGNGFVTFQKAINSANQFSAKLGYELSFEFTPDEHQLISDYRAFNAEGQEKIRDYVADLKDNLKYKKHPESLMDQEA